MANTYTDYTASAGETSFSYSFTVLLESHVAVEINGTPKTYNTDFTVNKATSVVTLQLGGIAGAGATAGDIVRVRRQSNPSTDLVDFADGSRLSASRLDLAYQHNRFLNEEASEISDGAITEVTAGGSTFLDAQNREVKNLPAPTTGGSATNKTYVDQKTALTTTNLTAFGQDDFTGDGTTTAFTFVNISPQVTNSKAFLINVDGITQNPSNYTVSTTGITFTTAPVNLSSITVVTLAGAASVNFPASFSGDDVTFDDKVTATTFEGNLTGDVTGNLTGDVTGNVTGDITGDVTGDITGDVTGNADSATTASAITGKTFTTDTTLATASNTQIPTATAVKTYTDNAVSSAIAATPTGVPEAMFDIADGSVGNSSDYQEFTLQLVEQYDFQNLASVSSGLITLQAGTYKVEFVGAFHENDGNDGDYWDIKFRHNGTVLQSTRINDVPNTGSSGYGSSSTTTAGFQNVYCKKVITSSSSQTFDVFLDEGDDGDTLEYKDVDLTITKLA